MPRISKSERVSWSMALLWFTLASSALYAMADYGAQQGIMGEAPATWPQDIETMISPDPERATLVLFAHPLCPCTRATLWELESIANRVFGMVNIHILFFEPEDQSIMPDVWAASDLKQIATRLPGARLHKDVEGRIASHFGAYTSGQVLLYDTNGTLQITGGITPSRGHTGTNPGRVALVNAILTDDGVNPLAPVLNPVYGCSLHTEDKGDRKLAVDSLAPRDS